MSNSAILWDCPQGLALEIALCIGRQVGAFNLFSPDFGQG
ncbi:unnamed protein product [Acidithrix sp. C25]|nr:unnamed protein product [Acidithrix sp. C25]